MTAPWASEPGLALAPLLKRAGSVIESEIRGPSMGRTLRAGTRIRIRCGIERDYPDGAIIAYLGGRGLVGHRVVGRGHDRQGGALLLTRGDSSVVCDPPVDPERILGEVIEWHDGSTWRPLPPAPSRTALGRVTEAGVLQLVRLGLAINPRIAARAAVLLAAVGQRLSRRASPP